MKINSGVGGQNQVEALHFQNELAGVYPCLLKYARRIAGYGADAEDLVHDAVERGLLRRHLFHDGRLEFWLGTILRNVFLDGCRRRQSWKRISVELAHLWDEGEKSDVVHDVIEPTKALPHDYDTDDVRQAVKSLTPRTRDVFALFVFERLSQREISRRLSLPISTVGTRLLRARRRLRAILESGASPVYASSKQRAGQVARREAGLKSLSAAPCALAPVSGTAASRSAEERRKSRCRAAPDQKGDAF